MKRKYLKQFSFPEYRVQCHLILYNNMSPLSPYICFVFTNIVMVSQKAPFDTFMILEYYTYFFKKNRCAIKSGKVLLQPQRPLGASNPLWDLGRYVTKDGVVPKMYRLISRSCNRTRRPQNFFGNFQTIHGRLII